MYLRKSFKLTVRHFPFIHRLHGGFLYFPENSPMFLKGFGGKCYPRKPPYSKRLFEIIKSENTTHTYMGMINVHEKPHDIVLL